jgi:hypothetical protein
MTYCRAQDHLERQVHDFNVLADEQEASAKRLKKMAWDAAAKRAYHQSVCQVCQGVVA